MRKAGLVSGYLVPTTACLLISVGFATLFLASGLRQSLPRVGLAVPVASVGGCSCSLGQLGCIP